MQSGDGGPASAEGCVAVVAVLERRLGVQEPSVRSVPAYVSSRGREAVEVAASVGLELDEWQQLVLEDGCGVRADGKWAAFEVAGEVARQNGKGGIIEARELAGIFAWGERLILHSAHEFQTATEAMLRMEELLAASPDVSAQVRSVSRSHGSEGFVFRSGQRLRYRTRTKGGGRGFTGDTLILDEAMVLQESFIGALLPTLSGQSLTRNPQVWYMGSAVDQLVHEHGVVFARLRARALAGGDPSLAYFGWSAADPVDDEDKAVTPDHPWALGLLADRDGWAAANPGLGIRISEEHVEKEWRTMAARTFLVERLGIGEWPATSLDAAQVIRLEAWDELAVSEEPVLKPGVCFAFDVTPDRSSTAIAVAGLREDGLEHLELVERGRGTRWVVERLAELVSRHRPVAVVCDGASPAAALLPALEKQGVTVRVVSAREHANACGVLYDLVDEKGARHLGQRALREALMGAARRPLGDAWAWSRRSSTIDISPLVAVTLAVWGRRSSERPSAWRPL